MLKRAIRAPIFVRWLLPLLVLLLAGTTVVAPVVSLASSDTSRDVEDGEEKESEKDEFQRETVRLSVLRKRQVSVGKTPSLASVATPTGCSSRASTPAPDTWSAPRRC